MIIYIHDLIDIDLANYLPSTVLTKTDNDVSLPCIGLPTLISTRGRGEICKNQETKLFHFNLHYCFVYFCSNILERGDILSPSLKTLICTLISESISLHTLALCIISVQTRLFMIMSKLLGFGQTMILMPPPPMINQQLD